MKEIQRSYTGGSYDGSRTDNWSSRLFIHNGESFWLRKCNSYCSPFHKFYTIDTNQTQSQTICCGEWRFWGDDLSWPEAIRVAERAIIEWLVDDD